MTKTACAFAFAVMVMISPVAHSSVVLYDIEFGGNGTDPDGGVGSFAWDDVAMTLSDLTWDFGNGHVGTVDDSVVDWGADVFGGTQAAFIFEILTLQDVHPVSCTQPGDSCAQFFGSAELPIIGWPDSFLFDLLDGNIQQYAYNSPEASDSGFFSTRRAAVREPATLGLLTLGLIALGMQRQY